MTSAASEKTVQNDDTTTLTNGVAFGVIVAITLLCFAPDLKNGLLNWDDSGYIVENIHIKNVSFETLRWAFGEFYLNYWAPLTWLSLAMDYAVWGLNPVGYHLTNNIIHALNAGMFFLISLKLLNTRPQARLLDAVGPTVHTGWTTLLCAMFAALFFAVHPLRVESVAWATERKDVLSLFFGLPAVLFYLRYTQTNVTGSVSRDYWLSLVLFTLSLMSKSLMVTLPALLLVMDWFPLKRFKKYGIVVVVFEKAPFFLLSCAASVLTMSAQAHAIEPVDWYTRLLNAFTSIVAYIWLTVWPFSLNPFYVHPFSIRSMTLEYALPIVFFIIITISCLQIVKLRPIFMAVWLMYLIAILPFLGLTLQVGAQAMAGRFTYLSGLPLAFLFSVGVTVVFSRIAGSRAAIVSLSVAMALLLLVNGYLTVREISFWRDDVTLWTRVIELSPNTGRAYFQRSYANRLKRDYRQSLSDIERAITIASSKHYRSMHELYRARAAIFVEIGEFTKAIEDYAKALETATGNPRIMILYERGLAYQKSNKTDLANDDFRLSTSRQ